LFFVSDAKLENHLQKENRTRKRKREKKKRREIRTHRKNKTAPNEQHITAQCNRSEHSRTTHRHRHTHTEAERDTDHGFHQGIIILIDLFDAVLQERSGQVDLL
jgi:hypothetical protein